MGKVLEYLFQKTSSGGKAHFTLIDPEKTSVEDAARLASLAVSAGTDAILVGGSIGVFEPELGEIIKRIKEVVNVPVILFPGNIHGISREADALLFMVMPNSIDPYYISGVQMQAAPIILRLGIEAIPTYYIIVGYGGAAGYVGYARPTPYEKPEITVAYALSGALLGMKFVYLEAGSGAPRPVPVETVTATRRALNAAQTETRIIVGGGIRRPETAELVARAGADILVTGNLIEENPELLPSVIRAFKGTT